MHEYQAGEMPKVSLLNIAFQHCIDLFQPWCQPGSPLRVVDAWKEAAVATFPRGFRERCKGKAGRLRGFREALRALARRQRRPGGSHACTYRIRSYNSSPGGLCSRALIDNANAECGEADVLRLQGGNFCHQDRNSLGRMWEAAGAPELSVSDATSPIRSRLTPEVSILNCHVTNAPSSDATIRP
jgi:hypothetical protein